MSKLRAQLQLDDVPWLQFPCLMGQMYDNTTKYCIVVTITETKMGVLQRDLCIFVLAIFECIGIKNRVPKLCLALNNL